jgi:hypothetical protein
MVEAETIDISRIPVLKKVVGQVATVLDRAAALVQIGEGARVAPSPTDQNFLRTDTP